jgi:hypothetical protein
MVWGYRGAGVHSRDSVWLQWLGVWCAGVRGSEGLGGAVHGSGAVVHSCGGWGWYGIVVLRMVDSEIDGR